MNLTFPISLISFEKALVCLHAINNRNPIMKHIIAYIGFKLSPFQLM